MVSFRVSRDLIAEAMQSQTTRDALAARAEQVKRRAEQLAGGEGVKMDVWVESGTRPQGRPFSNVYGDNVGQEWGASNTAKRRILGRAAQ